MTVVFQEGFGKVWTDNLTPCVFTLITEAPSSSEAAMRFFQSQVDLAQKLRNEFSEAYLLSDFSGTTESTRETLCNYYMEFLPKMIRAKISYVAFVCPESSFEALPSEKKEKLSQTPLDFYPTFADALAMINLKRAMTMAQQAEQFSLKRWLRAIFSGKSPRQNGLKDLRPAHVEARNL